MYIFLGCLYFIAKALEKDHCYTKGLVLKEKIFEEQPCLKRDTMQMFTKWWSKLTFLSLVLLRMCCSFAPCVHINDRPLCCGVCSDMSIHYVEVDEEERKSIVEEALEIRKRRQALSHCEPKPDLVLIQPIRCLSWVLLCLWKLFFLFLFG